MQTIKRVLLVSSFFVTAVALAFLLYPTVLRFVQFVNDGVSEGPGYYNPYTRFVPALYEQWFSVAFDLGLSALGTAALFYGMARKFRHAKPEG
jgi:hypothetical protein